MKNYNMLNYRSNFKILNDAIGKLQPIDLELPNRDAIFERIESLTGNFLTKKQILQTFANSVRCKQGTPGRNVYKFYLELQAKFV
jgi:hypothetical protein